MSDRPRDQLLDLPEGDPISTEHLDEKVHQAAAQQQALKRQLEAIERQQRELEEMQRRQASFDAGKAEMVERLTRSLVVLDREAFDAAKRVETIQGIQDSFRAHLDAIEAINPKAWEGLDIAKELTRALASVDDARAEYAKSCPKITAHPSSSPDSAPAEIGDSYSYGGGDEKDFVGWMKIGLAFSVPLIVFGLIALVVIVSRIK
jgi:hypothetical protein